MKTLSKDMALSIIESKTLTHLFQEVCSAQSDGYILIHKLDVGASSLHWRKFIHKRTNRQLKIFADSARGKIEIYINNVLRKEYKVS